MPQLGETVTEGTITRWHKQVGDAVAVDDVLFEVSTEKVDTEVPSAHAGFVRAVHVPEGDTVPVGTLLAVITDTADEPLDEAPSAPEPPSAAAAARPSGGAGGTGASRPTGGDAGPAEPPALDGHDAVPLPGGAQRCSTSTASTPAEVVGTGARRPHHPQRRAGRGGQPP